MQAVILAGGLGTRMRPLTESLPKAMIPVEGRPFLEYQIGLLRRGGIRHVVLCVGYRGECIEAYLGDGSRFGVDLSYSDDGDDLLGTAGAIKKAEPLLEDAFFVVNGDSYLLLDYRSVMAEARRSNRLGLMVVYRNRNRFERSNVDIDGDLVTVYDRDGRTPGLEYIDFGATVLRKEALRFVPAGRPFSQDQLWQILIGRHQLGAFETRQRFYEIGSTWGLEDFRRLVASGVAQP